MPVRAVRKVRTERCEESLRCQKQTLDPAERAYLIALPTSLRLRNEDVDRIVSAAGQILAASPEFQELVRELTKLGAGEASSSTE